MPETIRDNSERLASSADETSDAPIRLRKFADLSTAHLTEELSNWLEAECRRRADGRATEGMPSVWNLGTGFFIWIPDPDFEHPEFEQVVDPVLKHILAYAGAAGADYVLFDRDADVCSGLPVFDW